MTTPEATVEAAATLAAANGLSTGDILIAQVLLGVTGGGVPAIITPAFTSTVAQQLSASDAVFLFIDVTTAAALTIAIGATSAASTVLQNNIVGALGAVLVPVPAGWYVKLTGTMADLNITGIILGF